MTRPMVCLACGEPTRVVQTQEPRNAAGEVVPGVRGVERRRACVACGHVERSDEMWHADLAALADRAFERGVQAERRRLGRLVGVA